LTLKLVGRTTVRTPQLRSGEAETTR
jgi:hypothetical protein